MKRRRGSRGVSTSVALALASFCAALARPVGARRARGWRCKQLHASASASARAALAPLAPRRLLPLAARRHESGRHHHGDAHLHRARRAGLCAHLGRQARVCWNARSASVRRVRVWRTLACAERAARAQGAVAHHAGRAGPAGGARLGHGGADNQGASVQPHAHARANAHARSHHATAALSLPVCLHARAWRAQRYCFCR